MPDKPQQPNPQALTPKEIKEVQDFLRKKNIDIQINVQRQNIRRMEDGGFVIDPPIFTTKFVRIVPLVKNGNGDLKTV